MAELVFFGREGVFSRVLLAALVRAELAPALVMLGRASTHRQGVGVRRLKATPSTFDRIIGRRAGPNGPLSELALELDIEVLELDDPGSIRARAEIHKAEPDAFIVAGFHRLLPKTTLSLARLGGLNVHPGSLPNERGPSPLFWALKAGMMRHDYTIHVLDEGEDTGDIVATGSFDSAIGMTMTDIYQRCAESAAHQLIRTTRGLLAGDLVRTPQPRRGQRKPRPDFTDCRNDSELPAESVFHFVTACAAQYSVWAECAGDRFFIERAVSYDPRAGLDYDFVLAGDRLILRCRPGTVELSLKPEGVIFSAEYAPQG